jgi:hypothetical protein
VTFILPGAVAFTRSRRTGAAQAFLTGEIPPLKRLEYAIDCFRKNLHALPRIPPTMRRLRTQSGDRQIMPKVAIKNRGFFDTILGALLLFVAMVAPALAEIRDLASGTWVTIGRVGQLQSMPETRPHLILPL